MFNFTLLLKSSFSVYIFQQMRLIKQFLVERSHLEIVFCFSFDDKTTTKDVQQFSSICFSILLDRYIMKNTTINQVLQKKKYNIIKSITKSSYIYFAMHINVVVTLQSEARLLLPIKLKSKQSLLL